MLLVFLQFKEFQLYWGAVFFFAIQRICYNSKNLNSIGAIFYNSKNLNCIGALSFLRLEEALRFL